MGNDSSRRGGTKRSVFGGRRSRSAHDWPLSLTDKEQDTLETLASKGYEAGVVAVDRPAEPLHNVADGIVDADLATRRADAARRKREREEEIARAPAEAERAQRRAEHVNAKAQARADAENEAAVRRAERYDAEAEAFERRAEDKEQEAFELRQQEARLRPSRREPTKLVIKQGSFEIMMGRTTNWLLVAIGGAVFEGAIVLAPVMQSVLNLEDRGLAAVTGGVVSLMATAVAVVAGRGLAADSDDKSWSRRGLLIAIGVLLAGVIVGFIDARSEGWWVGLAVAATWTTATFTGYDLELRSISITLLERAAELVAEAAGLRDLAARRRVAADDERDTASAVADVVEPQEPPLLHVEDSAEVDFSDAQLAIDRAEGLKVAYKGVIDHQIGLGQADRRDAEAAPAPRVVGWQTGVAIGAATLLLAAGGYALGERDDVSPPEGASRPATPTVTP